MCTRNDEITQNMIFSSIVSHIASAVKPNEREIIGIQYLRAIAAIAVVFDHCAGMTAFPKYFGHSFYEDFFKVGSIGVSLFFVISGFIICIVSLSSPDIQPKTTIKPFALRRFSRIVPVMWIAIVAYMVLRYAGTKQISIEPYINAFFLLPFGPVKPNIIWTLRHEFIFYTVFAISFLISPKLRWLMGLWIALPIILFLALGRPSRETIILDVIWMIGSPVNIYFGAGLAIGIIWLKWLNRKTVAVKVGLFAPSIALFISSMFVVYRFDSLFHSPVARIALICSVFSLLVLAMITLNGRINSVGLFLGAASYSIYLFHLPIESAMLLVWSRIAPETPVGIVVFGVSIAAIAASSLIYIFVEVPVVRFCQHWLLGGHREKTQSARIAPK